MLDTFSTNDDDLHLYLKCHSATMFFKYLASKNQLPGFYISGALAENGLILAAKSDDDP